ncbi:ribonuclease R family protein [Cerasicoccus fimbriatus]|uniref:ribonuclease R family protein n=1 Tax=Cerasicoccus fimbriatus TaxID=3014554 RepID=UPI0022B3BE32|nr:RNB domain-containing ribonuclease [Cerasicoccus sp. TK19100]
MALEESIIELLGKKDYSPLRQDELSDALLLRKTERKQLRRTLHKLLDEGVIARVKKDRFVLPKDADLVAGDISFRQSGSARVFPEQKPGQATREPLEIKAEDTGLAMHGDKVLVRVDDFEKRFHGRDRGNRRRSQFDNMQFGRVIRILQRKRETFPGTLKRSRMFWYVIPDDPRIIQDILVPPPEQATFLPRPKEDDKVIVRMLEWRQRHLNPEGEIIEVLGQTHEPGAEFKALLHKFDLSPEFPQAVSEQVLEVSPKVTNSDIGNRFDARKIFTFTIDPDDAKDFDDALSIEYKKGGGLKIGVHIADVSAYVKHNTPLDREAQKRGNSTYLVGCVIPMLPHALSNGICSLVEAEDRLVKTVWLDFDAKGALRKKSFSNSVIRSNKRLTYAQALALLKQSDLEKIRATPLPAAHQTGSTGRALNELQDNELEDLQKGVRALWKVASNLRRDRFKKGSLELDMPEVKIYVDEDGYADKIVQHEYDESHQLIEEYMLLANEVVAKELSHAQLPYLSRVHDEPEPEKLDELRQQMAIAGIKCGDLTKRSEVTKLLKAIKDHPQGYTLRISFLRSLKQACYRAEADGHYGLAKQFYAHFTSPIRRYSDLIVHRIFDFHLVKSGNDSAPSRPPKIYAKNELDRLGEHVSITERNSQEAERESNKIKLLEYFEREAERPEKNEFDAVITDARNHGLFIELTQTMAFGMVHISTLQDDIYHVVDGGQALLGRKQQKRYSVGDNVKVVIERIDRFKRQMDFRLTDQIEDKPRRGGRGGPPRGRSQGSRSSSSRSQSSRGQGGRSQGSKSSSSGKSSQAGKRNPSGKSSPGGKSGGRGQRKRNK